MKRKNTQNLNGISVSDSIVMSVKRKNAGARKPFSALIAVLGFASILLAFLGMFHFKYDETSVTIAAFGFSLFYLVLSVIGGKALWLYAASIIAFAVSAYRRASKIALGFKFVYNIIYRTSYHTDISYYKALKASLETSSVTTLFIFYIWLLAIVVYFFTICRPNPILPLMVTFPVLEVGMYNGIEISIFWGMLCIAYWLSLLAMSTIDVGEYSGGQSGFVRKNDLFFPKRHMKLKVTEKCGLYIVASVMLATGISCAVLKAIHYERSESLNEKRRAITEAINDFSFDDLAESLSSLTSAFGFSFDYENHKLGNNDHINYKNVTDLTVTLDRPVDGAVYLKNYAGAVYKNNEWFDLPSNIYNDQIFRDFNKYGIHPQDFPAIFTKLLSGYDTDNTIWIKKSSKKSRQNYAPYGTKNYGGMTYQKDLTVAPEKKGEASYKFTHIDVNELADLLSAVDHNSNDFRVIYDFSEIDGDTVIHSGNDYSKTYHTSEIEGSTWSDALMEYCIDHELITKDDVFVVNSDIPLSRDYLLEHCEVIVAQLLQNSYKDFVYDNYLTVPDTSEMKEVRQYYSDILSWDTSTVEGKMEVLEAIRERMSAECTYSLYPRKTPSNRDFVNYFLLENHKGYCTHYATSGVMLARMAGIPARYATGYVIVKDDISSGKVNSDDSVTIEVKDNRSHAWAEIYFDGVGWIPFEFTAGYSSQEINTEPTTVTTSEAEQTTAKSTESSKRTTRTTGSATTKRTTSARVTETVTETTTQKSGFGIGIGRGSGKPLPRSVKAVITGFFILMTAALIILSRRCIILKTRQKRFSSGKYSSRIRSMYAYSERLLSVLKLRSEQGGYKAFAKEVEKKLSGDYFEAGSFESFTDIALKASFGQEAPDDEELKLCKKTIDDISDKLFSKSNFIQKLKLRFIYVLK